ncbi:hypothetical protein FACS1894105_04000 [Clostridia bacterium]|nr:hypothetical protein FACS1894105_04000 [Clostridia bacterium]
MDMKNKKRLLGIILAVLIIFSCVPLAVTSVAADDDADILDGLEDESEEDDEFADDEQPIIPILSHGILYDKSNDVILYGMIGKDKSTCIINLTRETLTVTGFTVKAYSVNSGAKWTSGMLSNEALSKLLNKGFNLQLANQYDSKTKRPGDDAKIVVFDTIQKRPKAPKLVVNYAIGADPTGKTPGDWVLTKRNGKEAVKDDIQIAVADSSGKNADNNGFGVFYPGSTNGIPVKPLTGVSPVKTVYMCRTAPLDTIPASKPIKIIVSSELKPTKYKVNYRTERIKLKKGVVIFAGTVDQLGKEQEECTQDELYLSYGDLATIANDSGTAVYLDNILDVEAKTVLIWKASTAKKPPSAKQIYKLAPRAELDDENIIGTATSVILDGKYEIFDDERDKWGALPKLNEPAWYDIRIKATAKGTGIIDNGYAASYTGFIMLDNKGSGIWTAEISS